MANTQTVTKIKHVILYAFDEIVSAHPVRYIMPKFKVVQVNKVEGKKEICLVIPSRGRPKKVRKLIDSIKETTRHPEKVEVIFRVDKDDASGVKDVIRNAKVKFALTLISGQRDKMLSNIWDDVFEYVTADRVMMCADDVLFRTPKWDIHITRAMKNPDKELHFCWGNDRRQGKHLATLPWVSRAWVEQVGFFVPRGYARDWCDTHLHDIARRLNKLGCNRMTYLKDVVFEHMHYSNGKASMDATYSHRLKMKCESGQFNKRAKERQKTAQKLLAYFNKSKTS